MRFNYGNDSLGNVSWERLDAALTAKAASQPIVAHPQDPSYSPNLGLYYPGDATLNDIVTILDNAVGLGTIPAHKMPFTADSDTNRNLRIAVQALQNLGITIPVGS